MQLKDKIVVVTGAASGIGRALAERFHKEGAKHVVCSDLNTEGAEQTAKTVGGTAITTNVGVEADVARLIESTENDIGPIDLFCSNAGIGVGPALDSPNEEWQASWDVNVMAHVYAARHLVPRMVERGGGYFMHTASAAGLLNQIGGAAYGVTKHAAVGFGEWLALSYQHEGIKVSMLCPQAVRTPMTVGTEAESDAGNTSIAAAAADGMIEPEELAEVVIEGLADERFLILPHAEVTTYMQRKTADYDRWIGGMNRMHRRLSGA